MIFDKQKNEDIKRLKKLRVLKDQTKYRAAKKTMIQKYGVSGRAVERWLCQRTPGLRKTRTDSGTIRNKITSKEKRVTKELLEAGMKIKDVKKKVAEATGRKISNRKLSRVRGSIEEQVLESAGEKIEESNFGGKAKEIFRKLFELDLVSPERGIAVEIHGKRFAVPKADCEDICLILANAWNRQELVKYRLDKMQYIKMKITHLVEGQISLLTENGGDTKQIESLTRMYDRLNETMPVEANLELLKTICRILKPSISDTEIYELVKSNAADEE